MSQPSLSLLDKITEVLDMSAEQMRIAAPVAAPQPATMIDGAPDQFELWADRCIDPVKRHRIHAIAAVLAQAKRSS